MEEHEPPTLEIDNIDDFYKFTVDSFRLINYQYNPFKVKVPIAV